MKKLLLTLLILMISTLTILAQEKIYLRIKPQIDKSLNYQTSLKTSIHADDQDIDTDIRMNMTMLPTQITDTAIIFTVKYTDIKIKMDAGLMMIEYDSKKEADSPTDQLIEGEIKPILENTLTMVMSPNGEVKKIDFPNVSQKSFDKTWLQNLSLTFPTKEISIGDTWDYFSESNQLGLPIKITNTLSEKTKDGYRITIDGSYTDDNGKALINWSGIYILDLKTNLTKYASSKTTIDNGAKISILSETKIID